MNIAKNIALALTLALVAFAAACGGSSAANNDPNSPTGVSKRFIAAAQAKDPKAFKSLLAKQSIASMEKDAQEAGLPLDQMLVSLLNQDLYPKGAVETETRNEAIKGDRATVEIKGSDGKWAQNELVREDGNWKITLE